MKKWLARAVVLAMIVAMMVPMPVAAAKSSGGGKLVASVTTYVPDGNGWTVNGKTSYKYGKGNIPTEVTDTYYQTYLGVPVRGGASTHKIKSTSKSVKIFDTAGFVSEKHSLKGGNVVSYSWDSKNSYKEKKDDGTYYDYANLSAEIGHASYFKNGLVKTSDWTYSSLNSDGNSNVRGANSVYAWNQKKGVPSLMYKTTVYKDDTTPYTEYAIFNTKGLVLETGSVIDGKNVPDTAITYTMKKGKVDTAVIYSIDEGKPTPEAMLKFKYAKKSVSKTFYLKMMNDLVEYGSEDFSFNITEFMWY